ncbi:hypothetical protein CDAR_528691 [Caerostris darwini]|uniref:Uncharacterized protein n=1 Tax=Caerostris darwini TaxID=1538125 RepID=A0AAV4UP50_9ARAC|nr:hypothetical protein CDAR_528691 [Caerostris darwini]
MAMIGIYKLEKNRQSTTAFANGGESPPKTPIEENGEKTGGHAIPSCHYVLHRARTRVVKSVVAAAIIVYFCIKFYSSCGVPMRILAHLLQLNQMEWL